MVTNYQTLVKLEAKISELKKKQNSSNSNTTDISDGTKATDVTGKTGTPVYYVSNLHAGKDFYLDKTIAEIIEMHKYFVRYLFFILPKKLPSVTIFPFPERNMLKSSNLHNNCAYFSILFFQNQPPECNTPADLGKFHIFFIFSDIYCRYTGCYYTEAKLEQSLEYLKAYT